MTYREKIEQEHPEAVGDMYFGGVAWCPHVWGYEDKKACECAQSDLRNIPVSSAKCRACWNREIGGKSNDAKTIEAFAK